MKKQAIYMFIFILVFSGVLYSQELDITNLLKMIEAGKLEEVKKEFALLKEKGTNEPGFLFIDAILTEDGDEAMMKYNSIYRLFPKSQYADASLYRVFSYYYSLGYYKKASEVLIELKNSHPNSRYFSSALKTMEVQPDDDKENPQTEKPVKEEKKQEKVYRFTIQAGAFLSYENALKVKNKFAAAGYFTSIDKRNVAGSILNVVTIGRFESEQEANSFLQFLNTEHETKGRIINIE